MHKYGVLGLYWDRKIHTLKNTKTYWWNSTPAPMAPNIITLQRS